MKLKIHFAKEVGFVVPDEKIIRARMKRLPGTRLFFRTLALAGQPGPCRRHVD